jgi:hypothetical protein
VTADRPDDGAAPRLRGTAAWKAQRDAIEHQNAAAKKRAHLHEASAVAAAERARRLELQEQEQLRILNARLLRRR